MAVSSKKISNISSGVYFLETDLTIIEQNVGTFSGALIGLTEKGPAFEVMTSNSYSERVLRMGDLNPNFLSSYYANEYLEQAGNYKEVRVLGLEGYTELPNPASTLGQQGVSTGMDKSFVILYNDGVVSQPKTVSNPVIAGKECVAAVLKPRYTNFTGGGLIANVQVVNTIQRDGVTNSATDDLFGLQITYTNTTLYPTVTIPCSLRPEAREYIARLFGTLPMDKAQVNGATSPLWVDFVFPSQKRKLQANAAIPNDPAIIPQYYYPFSNTPSTFLNLVTGDMTISLGYTYPTGTVNTITTGTTTTVTITSHGLTAGTPVTFTGTSLTVTNVTGVTSLDNETWYVGTPITSNTFVLFTDATLSTALHTSGTFSAGTYKRVFIPTWEAEVMTLGGYGPAGSFTNRPLPYQTPITPWFVSDTDINGKTRRIFRVWSISDGDAANTEIKLEIQNINPAGNINKGSFDIVVRKFSDREDTQKQVLEIFSNLTLDPKSDNYILRRIGDGEDFAITSRYIFIELYADGIINDNDLPYGVEGYVMTTSPLTPAAATSNVTTPDIIWTTEYDFTKPIQRQTLGLPNNFTNMFTGVLPDQLSYTNVANLSSAQGLGFHLNPQRLTGLPLTELLKTFIVASDSIYRVNYTPGSASVNAAEQVKRSKYVVCLSGGFDGFNVYNQRSWGDPTSKDYEAFQTAVNILSDKENLNTDFSVLVTPDINFREHSTLTQSVLDMVQTREDALYIFDFNYELDPQPEIAKDDLQASNMLSNYSAVYYPWVQIQDSLNKVSTWNPPSIIALATIAYCATNEQVWQPPAGSLRTVTNNLVRTRKRMKIDDREILKSININPITEFPGTGFEITETRTTQSVLSALSFIHNRLLLGYAKKILNQTLRPLLHQLNNNTLENNYINLVTPIFERIKKLNGLSDFKVTVQSNADDRTTLYGNIEIVPLYPTERIIITFTLSNGTLNFNE